MAQVSEKVHVEDMGCARKWSSCWVEPSYVDFMRRADTLELAVGQSRHTSSHCCWASRRHQTELGCSNWAHLANPTQKPEPHVNQDFKIAYSDANKDLFDSQRWPPCFFLETTIDWRCENLLNMPHWECSSTLSLRDRRWDEKSPVETCTARIFNLGQTLKPQNVHFGWASGVLIRELHSQRIESILPRRPRFSRNATNPASQVDAPDSTVLFLTNLSLLLQTHWSALFCGRAWKPNGLSFRQFLRSSINRAWATSEVILQNRTGRASKQSNTANASALTSMDRQDMVVSVRSYFDPGRVPVLLSEWLMRLQREQEMLEHRLTAVRRRRNLDSCLRQREMLERKRTQPTAMERAEVIHSNTSEFGYPSF